MVIDLNKILEAIVKILIVVVIILLIIGIITVGKRFVSSLQSTVGPLPNYEDHTPGY